MVNELLNRAHAFDLQFLYDAASVRTIDRALADSLMAEFARLQIIVGEDLDRVLKDFHKHVEAASMEFSRDLKEALGSHLHGLLLNRIEGLIERLVQ